MNRRRFLGGAGAVTLLLVGGGVWRATDQGVFRGAQGDAYAPWDDWREADGTPLALVKAGILAANPHNTQPWAFEVSEERIVLYAGRSRHLGSFDPYRREMYLGLGCALENMLQATGPNGYTASLAVASGDLSIEPPREGLVQVVELRLTPAPAIPHPLYAAIDQRHTHRGPYQATRLSVAQRDGLLAQIEGERVDREAELGVEPAARRELAALLPGEQRRPTFAFRVGVAESSARPSPRRSVASTLVDGEGHAAQRASA